VTDSIPAHRDISRMPAGQGRSAALRNWRVRLLSLATTSALHRRGVGTRHLEILGSLGKADRALGHFELS